MPKNPWSESCPKEGFAPRWGHKEHAHLYVCDPPKLTADTKDEVTRMQCRYCGKKKKTVVAANEFSAPHGRNDGVSGWNSGDSELAPVNNIDALL